MERLDSFRHRLGPCCLALGAALLLMGFLAGCGGSKGPKKEVAHPIKATLTLDGQPFGPLFLMLHSTKLNGPMIAGMADEKGNVKFTTNKPGDGAPAGEYKLVVFQDPKSRAVKAVPDAYREANMSPTTVNVEAKKNELTFAIESVKVVPAGGKKTGR